MSDGKCASKLLLAAERDFTALRGMTDTAVFADEVFGFHVQQAAEKALKAWIALLGHRYPTTRDLKRLVDLLKAHEPRAADFASLSEYTPYAVEFRCDPEEVRAFPVDRARARREVEGLLTVVRRVAEAVCGEKPTPGR